FVIVLGTRPAPLPLTFPSLKEDTHSKAMSMRQRMEQHRANVVCASCHARMDPMGFALENFDAIGRLRTRNSDGSPVDASGVFPYGWKFEVLAGLRNVLMVQPGQFFR